MRRTIAALGAGLLVLAILPALPANGVAVHKSPNMSHVASYQWRSEGTQLGTDLEFATIRGRDYAFAGTYAFGMQIIDITNPLRPTRAGVFECGLAQGDVQVFRQGARWLATYTADDGFSNGGACYSRLGVSRGTTGTFIADVTEPTKPRAVGFLPIILGSHNMTVHPGGRFLYNSDSELPGRGQVEIWDIANPAKPKQVRVIDLLPVPRAVNSAPTSSHDITFNAAGTRAYVAALTYTVVLDTTAPGAPHPISWIADPAVTLHHQSDPVTVQTVAGPITYLVISDELGGGATNVCPGGGLHVYNITGPLELAPVKLGAFFAPYQGASPARACTSHVLRMHPEEKIMTIGWYGLGSRVIDFSGLIGLSAGPDETRGTVGPGMREVGYLRYQNSDTWTAKTNRIARDGSFFLYVNDHQRGFEVLRYTPPPRGLLSGGPGGIDPGRWLTPAQALDETLERRETTPADPSAAPYCVLPSLAA